MSSTIFILISFFLLLVSCIRSSDVQGSQGFVNFPADEKEITRVWQNVLPQSLFDQLRETMLTENAKYHKEVSFGTFWFPSNRGPTSVIEEVILHLRDTVMKPHDFIGAEWWIQNRDVNQALFFHFDSDQILSSQEPHVWRFPDVSTIFYLNAVGGPTLVLNQRMSLSNESDYEALVPPTAEDGYLIYPQSNQFAMFRGDRLHGVLNANATGIKNTGELRLTLLVNFWRNHKPSYPACIEPQLLWPFQLSTWISDKFNHYFGNPTSQDFPKFPRSKSVVQVEEKNVQVEDVNPVPTNLDLQLGLHNSVKIKLKLPKIPQLPGIYRLFPDQIPASERPLLELAMELKNPPDSLGISLALIKPYIDRFTIVYGSDEVRDVCQEILFGIPGNFIRNSDSLISEDGRVGVWSQIQLENSNFIFHLEEGHTVVHPEKLREISRNLRDNFSEELSWAAEIRDPGNPKEISKKTVLVVNQVESHAFQQTESTQVLKDFYIRKDPVDQTNKFAIPKYSKEDVAQWAKELEFFKLKIQESPDRLSLYAMYKLNKWMAKTADAKKIYDMLQT